MRFQTPFSTGGALKPLSPVSAKGLVAERLFQKGAEIAARDKAGAKAGQVGGFDLAVDKVESHCLEMRDQGDEGRLGGVGDRGEHRFAEEGAAEGNAIEAADEIY
jgi:hypothetical protein